MSRYDRPSHRVYMSFFSRSGWQVQFLEADLKTPLPRKFTFTDADKISELARRGEAWGDSESEQMLEHAIESGRGGVYRKRPKFPSGAQAGFWPEACFMDQAEVLVPDVAFADGVRLPRSVESLS